MEKDLSRAAAKLLVLAGSAGSLDAILVILTSVVLAADLAVLVVVHRKSGDDGAVLINLLKGKTQYMVKEAEEKDLLQPRCIYVAPGDYHLLIESDHSVSLDYSEKINFSRPSIDVSMQTAADAFGSACAGVLLSGANSDGTKGLIAIKEAGGLTIVQDPATAAIGYMPEHAVRHAAPSAVMDIAQISHWINIGMPPISS